MKKRTAFLTLCIMVMASLAVTLVGCKQPAPKTLTYALDDSIPFLYGNDITQALSQNPYRGLRHEFYITLNDTTNFKKAKTYPSTSNTQTVEEDLAEKTELYADYNFTVAQVYVYLTNYIDTEISSDAFYQLGRYLSELRTRNISCLLRFAYEYDESNLLGPTTERMLSHIAQIKSWLNTNTSLINTTVLAFQAGFVGLWGEWHTSQYKHDTKTVINAICDMIPAGKFVQVRTAQIKEAANANYKRFISYHDDYITGEANKWSVAGARKSSKRYKNFLNESPLSVNDGEMPWGSSGEMVDGISFIRLMQDYCFTTFSAEHNFIEQGNSYSLSQWQGHMISAETLNTINSYYNPNWFKDASGNAIDRTVFDYVQDYLGYQLVASNLLVKNSDSYIDKNGNEVVDTELEFVITNFGTAAPYLIDKIEFVFRNPVANANGVHQTHAPSTFSANSIGAQWSTTALRNMGQIKFTVPSFARNAGWQIGIKIYREGSSQTVRLANDIPFIDGVNYIG